MENTTYTFPALEKAREVLNRQAKFHEFPTPDIGSWELFKALKNLVESLEPTEPTETT